MRTALLTLLLWPSLAWGQPLPAELKLEPGRLTPIQAEVPVTWYTPDAGLSVVPASAVGGKPEYAIVQALKPGRYRLVVSWAEGGEPKGPHVCTLVAGDSRPDPDPDDPTDPDPEPEPPKTSLYYFAVVRPDGPASEAFEAVMRLAEWRTLEKDGHRVKDFTVTEAAKLGLEVPAGTTLPTVITLSEGEAVSEVVRGPIPLPTTGTAILKLTEGIDE